MEINIYFERKVVNINLCISFNICFECSKEPPHSDSSFEYHNVCFEITSYRIIYSYPGPGTYCIGGQPRPRLGDILIHKRRKYKALREGPILGTKVYRHIKFFNFIRNSSLD